jgi:hypothetical protein
MEETREGNQVAGGSREESDPVFAEDARVQTPVWLAA